MTYADEADCYGPVANLSTSISFQALVVSEDNRRIAAAVARVGCC